jgi:AraC family transcriptional regulator
MNPVGRALWFVESHFASEVTLEDIANTAGVSRFHLTRAFGAATGYSIMRYVRARRLTEAARSLANGAGDILTVALDAGYGSHEAFTRVFREHFGVTPETLRAQGHVNNIQLTEPIKMQETLTTNLQVSRFEHGRVMLIGGIGARYTCESSAAIPAQWQRFLPHLGNIPGQTGSTAYGVNCNQDDEGNFDYICGVEVTDFSRLPSDWSRLRITPQRYAVFSHRDHISTIRSTWSTIWNQWLPESGLQLADAPYLEVYTKEFDSRTGMGGLEIWIPVKS